VNERKGMLLRIDQAVYHAVARWATDQMRSTNAQIEYVLRRALAETGRMPGRVGEIRRPGRPPHPADRDGPPGPVRHEDAGPDASAPDPTTDGGD
jgi:hypothetical protein